MWLITNLVAAIVATVFWRLFKGKFQLGFLSLLLWGGTVMILIDHILGYEGGKFIEVTTDGMVRSGTLLGLWMLLPVLIIWAIALFLSRSKEKRS